MKVRIALVLLAAVVIGAVVLPSTSVFAGKTEMIFDKIYDIYDYSWVLEYMNATERVDLNISGGCAGCHGAIQDQLNNSLIHSDFGCEECHKITKTASGEEIEYSNQTHDLIIPRCLDCHENNGTYSNDTGVEKQAPTASGFNESGYGTNASAHKQFVEESLNYDFSKGENEACINCHTNQSTEVVYKYFWNIEYSIDGWSISSLSYNGSREHTSNYTRSEEKHVFLGKKDINCVGCHQNVYDTLVNGTYGADEDYLSHAPIEINDDDSGTGWSDENDCWNNFRYHHESQRSENVNTEYCIECHKVDRYAETHSTQASTYSLTSVVGDTNSMSVHAAESVSCGTCHGDGKTKEPACSDHNPSDFVEQVSSTYARTVVGDICMGCHEAAVHPDNTEKSCNCHTSNTYVENVYIESEPSGLACNSRGKPCPTGPEAYFEWTPLYPQPNESVEFNASDSTDDGTIESYQWEFGDGNTTTASDPTISHIYSSEGEYVVNLTVTDDAGLKDTYTDTVNVTAGEKAWVYQEDANITSCSSGWLLSQPCNNTYDGDWETYGTYEDPPASVNFTYTKPAGAVDAKWKVKDQGATVNLTLPDSCWNYYTDKIELRAKVYDGFTPTTSWYCYNGSWNNLRTAGDNNVYEEAIWWWK